ncbi:prepilin-type N-terminal cleavage/methylation domain-containing protein [Vibrio sp. S4M6]|uniref:prepilin-type N-terminal cleavage/methylation domain-containing protein n=1 Tax=Vibrio sinus TaxID=2946865 RepID=UPI00202A79D8|nr:prepilin-type N-terminal cleavage/methylation domain-containing protein [Vibrio sinus]
MNGRYRLCSKGFTLVELLVVVLLIAIVSVYAASRYFGVSHFSAFAAQAQAISIIRQVQVNRMQSNVGSSSSNNNFILAISSNCIGSVTGCATSDRSTRSDVLSFDSVSVSSTPSLSQVTFDLLGNPEGSASPGVTIAFSDDNSSASVCINSQGFVSRGAC